MTQNANVSTRYTSLDTTFVLFFLSLELGRSAAFFTTDTLLLVVTWMMVLVLPYFLIEDRGYPPFAQWLTQRVSVGVVGLLAGVGLRQSVGVLIPEAFGYLPMTLLIISSVVCSYVQIYGLMRLRLAK